LAYRLAAAGVEPRCGFLAFEHRRDTDSLFVPWDVPRTLTGDNTATTVDTRLNIREDARILAGTHHAVVHHFIAC